MAKVASYTGWVLIGLALTACGAKPAPGLSDVSHWRGRLARGDGDAVKALRARGPEATQLLATLLADPDVTVVTSAGLVAEGLGAHAGSLAPQLLGAVVRFPGDGRMLGPLRTAAAKPSLAPYLLGVLETGTVEEKTAAIEVLTHYGKLAAPGVASIVPLLESSVDATRLHAMNTLNGIGADAESALPALEAAGERATSDHERRTANAAIRHIQSSVRSQDNN